MNQYGLDEEMKNFATLSSPKKDYFHKTISELCRKHKITSTIIPLSITAVGLTGLNFLVDTPFYLDLMLTGGIPLGIENFIMSKTTTRKFLEDIMTKTKTNEDFYDIKYKEFMSMLENRGYEDYLRKLQAIKNHGFFSHGLMLFEQTVWNYFLNGYFDMKDVNDELYREAEKSIQILFKHLKEQIEILESDGIDLLDEDIDLEMVKKQNLRLEYLNEVSGSDYEACCKISNNNATSSSMGDEM